MTNSPGDGQPPQEQPQEPTQPTQQPGYWEQQQGQQGYGQPNPYGQQAPYGQPGPYGQAPGYPAQYAPDHPRATTSLILGILGLVVCGVIAPFAWRMGKQTLNEIDASQGRVGGRGAAQAGYVLGIIGTVLLSLGLLVLVLYLGLMVAVFSTGNA